jgi:hypothetical protein
MKKLFIISSLMLSLTSFATIEHSDMNTSKPTETEVETNRKCFRQLEDEGCGDPGEDIHRFRVCMNNVFPTLTKSCQKLMTDLYK